MTKSTSVDTDWTERCPASADTSEANCPFPEARAFDHNNQRIDVTTTVERVTSASGVAETVPCTPQPGSAPCRYNVLWGTPAIYLFKYQAQDSVGNTAEHIVFELVLDDLTKPEIDCAQTSQTFEVYQNDASTQPALDQCTITDNIADSSAISVVYTVQGFTYEQNFSGKTIAAPQTFQSFSAMNGWFHTPATLSKRGTYTVTIAATDTAGMFGAHGESNTKHESFTVEIKDTQAPSITLDGQPANPQIECGTPYRKVNGVWENTISGETMSDDQHRQAYIHSKTWTDPGVGVSDLYDTDMSTAVADPCASGKCLDVDLSGTYTVKYTATDSSGNEGVATRTVRVVDTMPPSITLIGGELQYHQKTAHAYSDPGIRIEDNCDFYGATAHTNGTHVSYLDQSDVALGADHSNVRIWYTEGHGGLGASVGNWSNLNTENGGRYSKHYEVTDRAGLVSQPVHRDITIVDDEKPILKIEGQFPNDVEEVDRSRTAEYQDDGATCHDYVHGNLNRAVRSTGDIVNLAKANTYYVTYTCKDPSGNHAEPATKTIIVKDRTCPVITLAAGTDKISIEAGFPYVDQKPTCSDDFDGVCAGTETEYGNTVNYARAFRESENCAEIKLQYPHAQSGYYLLKPFSEGYDGKQQFSAWCDMENVRTYFSMNDFGVSTLPAELVSCSGTSSPCYNIQEGKRAFYPRGGKIQSEVHVVTKNDNECTIRSESNQKLGETQQIEKIINCDELLTEAEQAATRHKIIVADSSNYASWANEADRTNPTDFTEDLGEGHATKTSHLNISNLLPITDGASLEDPHFVIHYHYTDSSGNTGACSDDPTDCSCPAKRTVYVTDSLPPVITLKLNHNLVAVSKPVSAIQGHGHYSGNTFVSTTDNTAYDNNNPFLSFMAESTTSVNGWAVAAVASFIAGVALLSYSGKSATTSVPV